MFSLILSVAVFTNCSGGGGESNIVGSNTGGNNEEGSNSGTPFITTWRTSNPGVSGNNQIIIPVYSGETYDYTIDWGDGSIDTHVTGSITHTYSYSDTYTVSISGTFPGISIRL